MHIRCSKEVMARVNTSPCIVRCLTIHAAFGGIAPCGEAKLVCSAHAVSQQPRLEFRVHPSPGDQLGPYRVLPIRFQQLDALPQLGRTDQSLLDEKLQDSGTH